MPHPEIPFLAAGTIAVVGDTVADKKLPEHLTTSIIGTVVLVLVSSASANTRLAPLVHAIGLLLCLTALLAAVKHINAKKGKK